MIPIPCDRQVIFSIRSVTKKLLPPQFASSKTKRNGIFDRRDDNSLCNGMVKYHIALIPKEKQIGV